VDGWVAELKDRYRLILVDLPGHGLTGDWPRGDFSIDAYADFIEVLADTLHLDRFAVAGHSMGGAVAWTFAVTRPERVSQLILVDAAGFRARAASCRCRSGSPASAWSATSASTSSLNAWCGARCSRSMPIPRW